MLDIGEIVFFSDRITSGLGYGSLEQSVNIFITEHFISVHNSLVQFNIFECESHEESE